MFIVDLKPLYTLMPDGKQSSHKVPPPSPIRCFSTTFNSIFSTFSAVLHHVFFTCPLFLPSAVQKLLSLVISCLSFLRTWPLYLNFHLAISAAMYSCFTISLSSLLDTFFDHLILNFGCRHHFMHTLSFLLSFFRSFQNSDPYSYTDFTLLLNILSFFLVVI